MGEMALHRYLSRQGPGSTKRMSERIGERLYGDSTNWYRTFVPKITSLRYLFKKPLERQKEKELAFEINFLIEIERATQGEVKLEDLVPGINWDYLRKREPGLPKEKCDE